ncbi:MAG: DUF192 domain-containing protein [Planctomycetota bacterium]
MALANLMNTVMGLGLAFVLVLVAGCDSASTDPLTPGAEEPTASALNGGSEADSPEPTPETLTVTIGEQTFDLELALDDDSRFQGLSDRVFIAPDGGMLFGFTRARNLEFVMRRCLVPIDIIFLDPAGRVTATHAMAVEPYDRPERQLRRYGSRYPAQFAIELAGGTLESLDLKPGDRVELPLDDLKARAE